MSLPLLCLPLFGIGMTEWIIIGIAIALFFGAAKLPKLGQGLGEGIRNFKKGIKGELDEDGNPIPPKAAETESEKDAPKITDETSAETEASADVSSPAENK